MYVWRPICTSKYTYVYGYVHVYGCLYVCMYVCLSLHVFVCVCLHVFMHLGLCVCVHVYVHSSIKDLINNYQQFIRNADIEAPTLLQTGTTNTIYIYISCLKHSLCNIYWVNEAFLYSFIIWNAFFVVIHRTYIYFTCMIIVFMWLVNLLKKRWTYSNMKL